MVQGMWHVWETGDLTEREHFENLGPDGRIILNWIFQKWDGGINWIDLVQDMDMWQSFVKVVVTFRFCKMRGIYSLYEEMLTSQGGLNSAGLVRWIGR
jgi:hypothetical protein